MSFLHADSEISSHALSAISNEVIFFSSTLGLEVLNSREKSIVWSPSILLSKRIY